MDLYIKCGLTWVESDPLRNDYIQVTFHSFHIIFKLVIFRSHFLLHLFKFTVLLIKELFHSLDDLVSRIQARLSDLRSKLLGGEIIKIQSFSNRYLVTNGIFFVIKALTYCAVVSIIYEEKKTLY